MKVNYQKKNQRRTMRMDKERLTLLLYNAIICLEENGYSIYDLMDGIGIYKEEYNELFGDTQEVEEEEE